jgi:tetratricopeptide (TPR) repeat protein
LAAAEDIIGKAAAEYRSGNLAEAERLYGAVLQGDATNFDALHMLGIIALQTKRPVEAERLIAGACEARPQSSLAWANRGNALQELGRFADAVACYDRAIGLDREFAGAFSNRGNALRAMGRLEEALTSFERAVALNPSYARAWSNRGLVLLDSNRPAEALASFERALAGDANFADAHSNAGMALYMLGRPGEALARIDHALRLRPAYPEALSNRGSCLKELERFPEALASFAEALRLKPDYHDARYNRGLTLLLLGSFAEGWRDYEWRATGSHRCVGYPPLPAPIWSGQALAGKRIIVLSEQGLGDTIQFARYLPLLRTIARDLFFYTRPSMVQLFGSLGGLGVGSDIPKDTAFDLAIPLLSLPNAFATTGATIPHDSPYLAAEPERVQRWRARIGTGGFRIGVCWQGNAASPADRGRSFPARLMEPLAAIPGVRLISLQQQDGLEQLATLPQGIPIETLEDAEGDGHAFMDTAAIMQSLDLVVTCDTAIAHLAGALGRPVWVALKQVAHWVWLRDRRETPWYPTMRLFRQAQPGAWEDLLQELASELRRLVAEQSADEQDAPSL